MVNSQQGWSAVTPQPESVWAEPVFVEDTSEACPFLPNNVIDNPPQTALSARAEWKLTWYQNGEV